MPIWTVFDPWLSSLCKHPQIAWTSISMDLAITVFSIFVAELVHSSAVPVGGNHQCVVFSYYFCLILWNKRYHKRLQSKKEKKKILQVFKKNLDFNYYYIV